MRRLAGSNNNFIITSCSAEITNIWYFEFQMTKQISISQIKLFD